PSFERTGTYDVKVFAIDSLGAASKLVTQTVTISTVLFIDDPDEPGRKVLLVGGTTDGDRIELRGVGGKKFEVNVSVNNKNLGKFVPTCKVIAYGGKGNDVISADGNIVVPVLLNGGCGNDRLNGGGGASILVGGDGDDQLKGEDGRDILIGGAGSDYLD